MIETERLVLRLPLKEDLDAYAALLADPETTRYGPGVADREESWRKLLQAAGIFTLYGYTVFTAQDRATGAFVGTMGLAHFERGLGEDFDPFPEGAWSLASEARGQGLAREGMAAMLAWFDAAHGPRRCVCIISHDNAASLKLAERLGFKPYGEAVYRESDVIKLAREAD